MPSIMSRSQFEVEKGETDGFDWVVIKPLQWEL
jgi:hypothetical protein